MWKLIMKVTKRKIFFLICIIIFIIIIRPIYYQIIVDYTSNKLHEVSEIINECIRVGVNQGEFKNYCYSNIFSIINTNIMPDKKEILKKIKITIDTNYFYKNRFTFLPITPAGEAIISITGMDWETYEKLPNTKSDYWIWGRISKERYILKGYGRNVGADDKDISWYYQCSITKLNIAELEKEKEYRKKKGLPELKK